VSYLFTPDVSNYFVTSERRLPSPCPDIHETRNLWTAFCPHFAPNFIQIYQEIWEVRVKIWKVRVEIWKVRVAIHVLYAFKYSVSLGWFAPALF